LYIASPSFIAAWVSAAGLLLHLVGVAALDRRADLLRRGR